MAISLILHQHPTRFKSCSVHPASLLFDKAELLLIVNPFSLILPFLPYHFLILSFSLQAKSGAPALCVFSLFSSITSFLFFVTLPHYPSVTSFSFCHFPIKLNTSSHPTAP